MREVHQARAHFRFGGFAALGEQRVGLAVERQQGAGKRARFTAFGQHRVQSCHGRGARGGDGGAGLGHFGFQAVQPHRIARTEFQQPRPFAHRGFIAQRAPRMAGIEAEHKTVEEPPPPAGAFGE